MLKFWNKLKQRVICEHFRDVTCEFLEILDKMLGQEEGAAANDRSRDRVRGHRKTTHATCTVKTGNGLAREKLGGKVQFFKTR